MAAAPPAVPAVAVPAIAVPAVAVPAVPAVAVPVPAVAVPAVAPPAVPPAVPVVAVPAVAPPAVPAADDAVAAIFAEAATAASMFMEDYENVDVFPCDVFPDVPPCLLRRPNFKELLRTKQIFAFIVCMEHEIILYKPLHFEQRHAKHFVTIGKYLTRNFDTSIWTSWNAASRRLCISVGIYESKLIDRRTCYKFDRNVFLVKAPFTTGQRYVKPGTHHILQTHKTQMKLYIPRAEIPFIPRHFRERDQELYSVQTLKPYKTYAIAENTIYILLAIQDCFFSVHVVPTSTLLKMKSPLTIITRPVSD